MRRSAPFADLALLVVVPGTPALALLVGSAVAAWLGWLVAAGGFGAVFLIGRRSPGPDRILFIAIAAWVTLALATVVSWFALFASCRDTGDMSAPWAPPVAMGVVYFAVGLFTLRKRRLWGLPLALVLAFGSALILLYALSAPGTSCGFE
jgi:hypothetical protein